MIEEARIAHALSSWLKKGLPLYAVVGITNRFIF
jgi:hypothetical protein